MSKIVGYARVSTKEQSLARQIQALSEYVSEDMIIVDKASGKDFNRDGYKSLKCGIGKLIKGDTLYVTSLDRLGRNKEQLKEELRYFQSIGVKVKILDIPSTLNNAEGNEWIFDMVNNIIIEVLTSIAEDERKRIKKRQTEGIASMRIIDGKRIGKKGNAIGRPPKTFPENWVEIYNQWKSKKITATYAMEILDLKRNTFYNLVKKYENKLQ